MRWREAVEPVRMERIAIVAPVQRLGAVLQAVADAGVVEPELLPSGQGGHAAGDVRRDAAAETELAAVQGSVLQRGPLAAIAGWSPASALGPLAEALQPLGGAVVRLPLPRGAQPPTLLASRGAAAAFQPLVDTYGTVPYADLNPSLFAGLAYVGMFGMMFGDVAHGVLLALAGFLLLARRPAALARYRPAAPFVIGCGVSSSAFGLAYGEAFGPTGLVPTLWLDPLSHATTLLAVAIALGAALLAVSYALGAVNRWRERGGGSALVALSGVAGIALYAGLTVLGLGWYRFGPAVTATGAAVAAAGLVLGYIGLFMQAGGRAAGAAEAGVELFDAVVRLGTNTISFARLAAFGLTHAALGGVVWSGTTVLWRLGPAYWVVAALTFVVGNAVSFSLEALVAGIQALRLEYYELFSRIFTSEGRMFRPWHLPAPSSQKELS
jgi:V/A-type H+-transporting ATPase subunit I